MYCMLVKFNDDNRQWYYGTKTGLKLMLSSLTDVRNVIIKPIKNQLTDY